MLLTRLLSTNSDGISIAIDLVVLVIDDALPVFIERHGEVRDIRSIVVCPNIVFKSDRARADVATDVVEDALLAVLTAPKFEVIPQRREGYIWELRRWQSLVLVLVELSVVVDEIERQESVNHEMH